MWTLPWVPNLCTFDSNGSQAVFGTGVQRPHFTYNITLWIYFVFPFLCLLLSVFSYVSVSLSLSMSLSVSNAGVAFYFQILFRVLLKFPCKITIHLDRHVHLLPAIQPFSSVYFSCDSGSRFDISLHQNAHLQGTEFCSENGRHSYSKKIPCFKVPKAPLPCSKETVIGSSPKPGAWTTRSRITFYDDTL